MNVCPTCGGTGEVPDRKQQIIALRGDGLTWAEIARQLGISRQRVQAIKTTLVASGKLTED